MKQRLFAEHIRIGPAEAARLAQRRFEYEQRERHQQILSCIDYYEALRAQGIGAQEARNEVLKTLEE